MAGLRRCSGPNMTAQGTSTSVASFVIENECYVPDCEERAQRIAGKNVMSLDLAKHYEVLCEP